MTFPVHYQVDQHFDFKFEARVGGVVVASWIHTYLPSVHRQ
jgi:hypothetical protein